MYPLLTCTLCINSLRRQLLIVQNHAHNVLGGVFLLFQDERVYRFPNQSSLIHSEVIANVMVCPQLTQFWLSHAHDAVPLAMNVTG